MDYKKYRLGDLITQRREKYEGDDVPIAGITREGFMPPKQVEADTSIYNVFYLNDFVFNPARMELNSIVFNDVYPKAICSSLYEMFFVNRTDIIMPEYLNLYIKRDEFARHCEFLGSGSAREYCRVANISEIELELPPLEEQKHIVDMYTVLVDRIKALSQINDSLRRLIELMFINLQKDSENWEEKTLDYLADIKSQSVNPENISADNVWHYSIPAFDEKGIPTFDTVSSILSNKYRVIDNCVLVSKMNPQTKRIWKAINSYKNAICSTEFIVFVANKPKYENFLYALFNTDDFTEFMIANATGTTKSRTRIKPKAALDYKFLCPPDETIDYFCKHTDSIYQNIEANTLEIELCKELQRKIKQKTF